MAKHKKKKSEPTPDPRDSDKPKDDIPETESTDSKTENPPAEPIQTEEEKSEKDKKLNKLYWLRFALAVIAGVAATFIFEPIEGEERRWASIGFMIVLFIGTVIVAKGMKIQLPSADRKKIVTQGIGSYIFMYLFMWILSYTIINANTVTTGVISPIP